MLRPVPLNQGTSEVVGLKAGYLGERNEIECVFFCWVQCSFSGLRDHQLCVVNSQSRLRRGIHWLMVMYIIALSEGEKREGTRGLGTLDFVICEFR